MQVTLGLLVSISQLPNIPSSSQEKILFHLLIMIVVIEQRNSACIVLAGFYVNFDLTERCIVLCSNNQKQTRKLTKKGFQEFNPDFYLILLLFSCLLPVQVLLRFLALHYFCGCNQYLMYLLLILIFLCLLLVMLHYCYLDYLFLNH